MGERLLQCLQYYFKNCCCFFEYLIIPESNNAKTFSIDSCIAILITSSKFLMLATVELDYQLCIQAREISYIVSDRDLPPKTKPAELSLAQMFPQLALGVGSLMAQSTCLDLR